MKHLFVVMLSRGASYQNAHPLEAQKDWEEHRRFMNDLERERFVVLGGPLEGTNEVLLIFHATGPEEIRSRLADDPWHVHGLLQIERIVPWDLRIGAVNGLRTGE